MVDDLEIATRAAARIIGDLTHLRNFTPREVAEALRDAGLFSPEDDRG